MQGPEIPVKCVSAMRWAAGLILAAAGCGEGGGGGGADGGAVTDDGAPADPLASPGCGAVASGRVVLDEHFGATATGWNAAGSDPPHIAGTAKNYWLEAEVPPLPNSGSYLLRALADTAASTSALTIDLDVVFFAGLEPGAAESATVIMELAMSRETATWVRFIVGADGHPAVEIRENGVGANWSSSASLGAVGVGAHCVRLVSEFGLRSTRVYLDGTLARTIEHEYVPLWSEVDVTQMMLGARHEGSRPSTHVGIDDLVVRIQD